MRYDDSGYIPRLFLSERNLRTLLTKLDIPGSARTIVCYDGGVIAVTVEPDDMHYVDRDPGIMSAETERMLEEEKDNG